jgi:cobalt-zinc-cadmium efflux system membrane fusion protein
MKSIYIILISILLISCGNTESTETIVPESKNQDNEIVLTKQQFEGEHMALGTISEHTFYETVMVNGMIDVPPHNKARVTTFMGGYITKTPLLIGDQVKKGQLLVTLQNTEYVDLQQQFLEVAEQLNYLKSEYNRQKTLYDEKITSEKNYLKAESVYKSNLAHYNGLKKNLEMLNINPDSVLKGNMTSTINIYAPIEGFITKVNVSNGTYVNASDMIMEIVDVEHIHLELSVFEKDVMKIKKGQHITFKIPEASNKVYTAEVHLVGTTIEEVSRQVKVHGHIDNEEENFIVGMFVEAEIHINEIKSVGLPKEAIMTADDENNYVLVLKEETNGTFHFNKTAVNLGEETEDFVEILNSEQLENKQIIIKGIHMLTIENDSD